MKKRLIYISIFIMVILLGYFNYFADDKEIGGSNQVIETTNVTYQNEDYTVEAQKQQDFTKEKETAFEKAKAKVNDMFLSGDNVFIDKVRNLALKNNILGISNNGWKFTAQEANYNKLKDEVTSNTGVMAENEEKGIKISGQNFMTNSKMSYINLDDDVVLENGQLALKGDKGRYDDISKIITLSDNITAEGRGENEGILDGHFKNLKYDMQKKILEAWEPFDITYKDIKLSAQELFAKEDTKELKITKNVKIKAQGFDIKVSSIKKEAGSELLIFEGPISGDNGTYSFTATKGIYNTGDKVFTAYGKIRGKSKTGDTLVADKLVYDTQNKIITLISDENIEYTNKEGKLLTHKLVYNLETKLAKSEGSYTFNGPKYESKGAQLEYNDGTKDVKVLDGYLLDKIKKEKLSGKLVEHNLSTKDTKISGNVIVKNLDYNLNTENFTYDGSTQIADITGEYEVKFAKNTTSFKGKKARYNKLENKFISMGDIIAKENGYTLTGKDLEYNTLTGFGKLNSKVLVENKDEGVRITGDNLTFEKDKNIILEGNLIIETQKLIAKTEIAKYNVVDKNIYLDKKINFESKDGSSKGKMTSGRYSTATSVFTGNNFNGTSQGQNIVSEKLKYDTKTEQILLVGEYTIYYRDLVFKGINGSFNNDTKNIKGERSIITTSTGDEFISDRMNGNLEDMVLDFEGNINGHMTNKKGVAYFSGDYARMYFKKLQKYELYRAEITENAIFTEGDKTLQSNYIELDLVRNIAFAKDDTKITMDNAKSGKTKVTADIIELNTVTNIANLIGNVKLDNKNEKYGATKVTSEKGIIDQNKGILEFIEDVKIENKDSVIEADRGIYNMTTKKIKALGDVYINYKK